MKRQTLLVVHPSDEMYGADKVLLKSLEVLQEDWDIEVWLPTDVPYPRRLLGKALEELGIEICYVDLPVLRRAYMNPSSILGLTSRFVRSARLLIKSRPQTLYINTAALAPLAPVARLLGIPVVLHLHEYLHGVQKLILKPFLVFTTVIICVSNSVNSVLGDSLRRRSTTVYNGFILPAASPFPRSSDGRIRFLVASRWNSWKGHEVLLEAWDQLDREDVHLTILGGPPPSGEGVDVHKIVADLRRPNSVEIMGETDDVHAILRDCHVVVVPSIQPDPLPTIAIEAAAAGRVVVASDSGGLPEIVGHEVTGWLFPTGNVDRLATTISGIQKGVLHGMGLSARERYESRFDEARYRREIKSVFRSLDSKLRGNR